MTDPTFDSIFDDLVEGNERQQAFLRLLAGLLPGGGFRLLLAGGAVLGAGKEPTIAPGLEKKLLARARARAGIAGGKNSKGQWFYALELEEPAGVLFCSLPGASGHRLSPLDEAFLRNSVRLARMTQEGEELAAEKEQFVRQISTLKQQHGRLIEDNYRQYRLNQEKDKEYAKRLESEISRQTAELRETNARLEEISRLKSDFLANMSHELRTPMNAIIGFTELLSETKLDGEQAEYAQTIRQSAFSLLTLINDILDVAKIEAGKLDLEVLPFDLPEVVRNVAAMFRITAREKGVEVAFRLDQRIPARVLGDSNRLRQILVNLAGNALKFTEKGRVEILVSHVQDTEQGVLATFAVRDTGIGIPEARRQAIFDKFTQADGSTTRRYGGTGLGLAICQQLVALMGGEISVESELGKGSTFLFTIPLVAASEPAAVPAAEVRGAGTPDAGALAANRILLVEDNAVNQKLASIIITRHGFQLGVAADGLEALEQLKNREFDLVLMDVQMPNMDGYTATRKIREIEASPEKRRQYVCLRDRTTPLRIIGLTAHARKEDEQACYQSGMDAFLTKPVAKDKLIAALTAVMRGK
jgi:signal transduction histidine kinase/AmiR/NasT family two-component response regulator